MHDDPTDTNIHTNNMTSDTTKTSDTDERGIALSTALIGPAPNIFRGDAGSLPVAPLSRQTLPLKKTGRESAQIGGGSTE